MDGFDHVGFPWSEGKVVCTFSTLNRLLIDLLLECFVALSFCGTLIPGIAL